MQNVEFTPPALIRVAHTTLTPLTLPGLPPRRTSPQAQRDLQGFACRLYFTMQGLLQAQSGYNFTGKGGARWAGHGGASGVANSCNLSPTSSHQQGTAIARAIASGNEPSRG